MSDCLLVYAFPSLGGLFILLEEALFWSNLNLWRLLLSFLFTHLDLFSQGLLLLLDRRGAVVPLVEQQVCFLAEHSAHLCTAHVTVIHLGYPAITLYQLEPALTYE